jgi:hypothetical protein
MTTPRIIFAPRTSVGALLKFSSAAVLLLISPALRMRAAHAEPLVNPFRRICAGNRVNSLPRMV